MSSLSVKEILALSVSERMKLIEALWDSIVHVPESLPVGEAERAELDRRLEAYQRDPDAGSPWPDVLKRLQKRS